MITVPRKGKIALAIKDVDAKLRVLRVSGREGISQLFALTIDFEAPPRARVDFAALAAAPAQLELGAVGRPGRWFEGMISRSELLGATPGGISYRVELVPNAWRLTRNRDCRIFQGEHAGTIVSDLLSEQRILHRVRYRADTPPPIRPFCVQYRESDWAFISRLLENEGFVHYFERVGEALRLEITDDPALHPAIPGDDARFRGPTVAASDDPHISHLAFRAEAGAGAVEVRDYTFEQPDLSLAAALPERDDDAEAPRPPERFVYPGGHASDDGAKRRARLEIERLLAPQRTGAGKGCVADLAAGHSFVLRGYGVAALDGERYLVTDVEHIAEHPQARDGAQSDAYLYGNVFHCQPRAVPYRPPLRTSRPTIRGVQSARVVGRDRDEIHTDEKGRIKVQFPWDRRGLGDEHSSCWLRVSQLNAGTGWGAMFIPRVGQEVLVSFEDGDPDRPIVTGRVYNANHPVPFTFPRDKTKSGISTSRTPEGRARPMNAITFEDKKGAEDLSVAAHRNLTERAGHDASRCIGRNAHIEIKGERSLAVEGDSVERFGAARKVVVVGGLTEVVRGNVSRRVRAERGGRANQMVRIDGNCIEKISGKRVEVIEAAHEVRVDGHCIEKVGGKRVQLTEAAHEVRGKSSVLLSADKLLQVMQTKGNKLRLDDDSALVKAIKAVVLEAGGTIRIEAGGATIELANGTVTIKGAKVSITGAQIDLN